MEELTTIVFAIYGVGFAIGLCGLGLLAMAGWLEDRDQD